MGKRLNEPAENPSFIDGGDQAVTEPQKKQKPCRICTNLHPEKEPTPHRAWRLHTDTNETEKAIRKGKR